MDIIKPYKFIPKENIKSVANGILDNVKSNRRRSLKNCDIAEAVADYFDLSIEWTAIEADKHGEIAAMIVPIKKIILINEDVEFLRNPKKTQISKEGFKNSTLSHEIGHWVLHINQKAVSTFLDRIESGDSLEEIKPFLCRTTTVTSNNIEWQAQYFASCLLMPVDQLKEAKKGRDLTKWTHLYAIADELGVTISNLKNRLVDLNWIKCDKNSQVIYLSQGFSPEGIVTPSGSFGT